MSILIQQEKAWLGRLDRAVCSKCLLPIDQFGCGCESKLTVSDWVARTVENMFAAAKRNTLKEGGSDE